MIVLKTIRCVLFEIVYILTKISVFAPKNYIYPNFNLTPKKFYSHLPPILVMINLVEFTFSRKETIKGIFVKSVQILEKKAYPDLQ
jgi:hypothetical protein